MRSISCSESVELTDEEIDSIADETGVDKKYIKKSIELERVDTLFKEHNKNTTKEKTDDNTLNKFKNAYLFLQNQLFSTPNIPNFAKVTSVESPENGFRKTIVVHTKTDYPSLPDDEKDIIKKSFKFTVSKNYDLKKLNHILQSAGVEYPSELEDKLIPTKPVTKTNYSYSVGEVPRVG